MEIKPIYEYLLWDNCKNHCDFCFLKKNPILLNEEKKCRSIKSALNLINTDFVKGSHILFVGGELYDSLSSMLVQTMKEAHSDIVHKIIEGYIDLFYVNTNLIYEDLSLLDDLLSKLQSNILFDRLKFTTSFDLSGRFKTNKDKMLMLDNLVYLKKKYPSLNPVVNIILTKEVCNSILDNTFKVIEFMRKYNCYVNLLPYIVFNKDLMASRTEIFNALRKIGEQDPFYLRKYIQNMNLNQERRMYKFNGTKYEYCSSEISECGHPENFKKYSDKNGCYICDLNRVFNDV